MSAISFDAINQIQREKMLTGQEGWGAYISGWHRGMAGEIQKLIAYAPVRLEDQNLVQENQRQESWSVAVVAPASEVEGVIHTLYTRQFYLQVIIGLVVLSGTIVMLNFRYEQQFSSSLAEEVNRQKEKLQKSEARYQGLVENAADLIYTVDGDGRLLSINRYAANLFATARSSVKPETAGGVIEGDSPGVRGPHLIRHLQSKIRRLPHGVAPGSQGDGQGQEQAPPGVHRRPGILVFHQHRGHQG